jgi:hypothetical protein
MSDIEALAERIKALLENVCYDKRPCKACGKSIYFTRTRAGRIAPYTEEGISHFLDCPEWQRAKNKPAKQRALLDTLPDALEPKR